MNFVPHANESKGSTGQDDWLVLPSGTREFEVVAVEAVESDYLNPKTGQKRITAQFSLKLTEQEQAELHKKIEQTPPGKQQSYRFRKVYTVGYWGKTNDYNHYTPSEYCKFIAALFGVETQPRVIKWFGLGGGPQDDGTLAGAIDATGEFLQWTVGLRLVCTTTVSSDGRWANLVSYIPLGGERGRPEPEYQQFGARKFIEMLTQMDQLEIIAPPARSKAASPVQTEADIEAEYDRVFGGSEEIPF